MSDIVPKLLKSIEEDFFKEIRTSSKIKKLRELLKNNNATYIDANEFSLEVGEILASVFKKNIKSDILPEGRMFFNIGERILNPTLSRNYDLVSQFSLEVQNQLNKEIGLGLTALTSKKRADKIKGIIDRLDLEVDFEKIQWILDAPIVDFTQQVVNEVLEVNMNFQSNSGLKPTIKRTLVGGACDWCVALAGIYKYPDVPEDVYKRHERCRCTVEFIPKEGAKENVWKKKWR